MTRAALYAFGLAIAAVYVATEAAWRLTNAGRDLARRTARLT